MRMSILCEWYFFHWAAGIAMPCVVAAKHRYNAYDAHRVCFMGGHFIHLSSTRPKLKIQKILQVQWTHTRSFLKSNALLFVRYSILDFARSSTNQSTTVKGNNETNIFILFTWFTAQQALCNYLRIAIEECFAPFFERLNKRKIVYRICECMCAIGNDTHTPTVFRNRVIKNAFAIHWTIRHVNARNFIVFVIAETELKFRARGLFIWQCEFAELPIQWE